jgi:uncharacterized protein YukE
MTLEVDPQALRTYATQLAACGDDVATMADYIGKWTSFGWHAEGMINRLQPAHERFAGEVTRSLGHLRQLLEDCRTELEKAAAFYEHTDRTTAGWLDDTYPPQPRAGWEEAKQETTGG